MKKRLFFCAVMTAALTLVSACAAQAGILADFNDYQNPDGTYSYYFMQGLTVTMSEDWYQNTMVKKEGGAAASTGEDDLLVRVECDTFSFEIPALWISWSIEGTLYASKDGSDEAPVFFAQKAQTDLDAGDYVIKQKNDFLDIYRDSVVEEPEIITYEPEETDRKLTGCIGTYRSVDGSRIYTEIDFVETIGDDLYHYFCTYVSGTKVKGEYEDETTYFEFLHAIDTMMLKTQAE